MQDDFFIALVNSEFNKTKDCLSPPETCSQQSVQASYSSTLSLIKSIVGLRCESSICEPTIAQSCLNVLDEEVASLNSPSTGQVCPVMHKEDQTKICGYVQKV